MKTHWPCLSGVLCVRFLTNIIDYLVLAATFWRREVVHEGIRISMNGASPHMRTSLQTNYESEDIRLANVLINKNDKVLELGSSIGFLAIYCIKKLSVEEFAMVEANPFLKEKIDTNFHINGLEVPTFINAAAGPLNGEIKFNIHRDSMSSSIIDRPNSRQSLSVPQMTIPSIVSELPFSPNTLIMDIEGAEADIPIEHFSMFDKILAEFHPHIVGDAKIDKLINGLESIGFQVIAKERRSLALRR